MSDGTRTIRYAKRRRAWSSVAVAVALLVGSAVVAQSPETVASSIRSELVESFGIVPLSDGWLLQPHDSAAGFSGVELKGAELAIDGTTVSADELRARLGALAEPILQLAAMDASERRALLSVSPEAVARVAGDSSDAAAADVSEPAVDESGGERQERRERTDRREVVRSDAQVVVGSSVTIEKDEVARDVLVVGGSLTIYGRVKGDAVAVGGSIDVDGEVTGDVAAIGASVDLESGARVQGDVVSIGGSVDQAEGAVVEGRIQEVPFLPSLRIGGWSGAGAKAWHGPDLAVDFSPMRSAFGFAWKVFGIGILALLAALTLLIASSPVERVGRQVAEEPWKSGLVGLLSQILFFPLLVLLVIILVVSIVGIPFLLLLPFALLAIVLVCLMGYTAVAASLGWWSKERFGWTFASPFVALLVGIVLIEVWSLIGELLSMGPGPLKFFALMFGLFGGLVCYVVWTVGFGAAILSRFGMARGWGDRSDALGPPSWQTPSAAGFDAPEATGSETQSVFEERADDGPSGWSDNEGRGPETDE